MFCDECCRCDNTKHSPDPSALLKQGKIFIFMVFTSFEMTKYMLLQKAKRKIILGADSCKTDSCQFGFTADWAGQTLLTVCIYNGGMCERWIAGLRWRRLSHMCRARPAVAAPAAQLRRQRRPDTATPSDRFYVELICSKENNFGFVYEFDINEAFKIIL